MHSSSISHTINIFERLFDHLPPLVPRMIQDDAHEAVRHACSLPDPHVDEVEDILIPHGKATWPYRAAFSKHLEGNRVRVGEAFFLVHLPRELKKRYEEFQMYGGGLDDIRRNGVPVFFSMVERDALSTALFSMEEGVKHHTVQAILSVERPLYETQIAVHSETLSDAEEYLGLLRAFAQQMQEMRAIAQEALGLARAYEQGLCGLGPVVPHAEFTRTLEYLEGRMREMAR